MLRQVLRSLFIAVLVLTLCRAYAQNLVSNGGFESGDLSSWISTGGWTVASSAAKEGVFSANLLTSDHTVYELYQNIATTPGQVYLASAWFKNDVLGSYDNLLEIYWNDDLIGYFSNMEPFDWGYGFTYVTGTGNDKLTFKGYNVAGGGGGWYIDDVRLEPTTVPELPSLVSFGFLALSGLGLAKRFRPAK